MAKFKEKLEQFALKHKKDINKNPQLRQEFNQMCAKIGVDPLASKREIWLNEARSCPTYFIYST